jgi:hypothetical protein
MEFVVGCFHEKCLDSSIRLKNETLQNKQSPSEVNSPQRVKKGRKEFTEKNCSM